MMQLNTQNIDLHGDERGFSLIELVVGLFVMAEVLVVILLLFDVNNRISSVQTSVSDIQQSQRIAQHDIGRFARMAGRGGLPREVAINIEQDAADNTEIGSGSEAAKTLEGTDILTVRGVFSSPIYQVNSADPSSFDLTNNTLRIDPSSPAGIPQELDAICELIVDGSTIPAALVLTSPIDDAIYAVVEIDEINNCPTGSGAITNPVTIKFHRTPGTGEHTTEYLALSTAGAWPNDLTSVAFVGILEEYQYYIRKGFVGEALNFTDEDDPGFGGIDETSINDASQLSPKLSRAQLYPGTTVAWNDDISNLTVDIADNIRDLQIAVALDVNNDGEILEDPDDTASDEWIFNDSTEDTTAFDNVALNAYYLRVTTLAAGQAPEASYVAPPITNLEDREYDESEFPSTDEEQRDRMVRRRILTSVVDLRNQG